VPTRALRHLFAALLAAIALAALGGKAWLALDGPYLEALPPFPACAEASRALDEERVSDAIELAEAGDCGAERAVAEARWTTLAARFDRCIEGAWSGIADDATGLTCAVASDLIVFGDVRDLTRQGLAWGRGDATDPVLVALSTAGLALTFAPQVGIGNSLFKAARRAGALTDALAGSVTALVRRGAWRQLGSLFGDAGRIGTKLGFARGTQVLAFADDASDVADLARFAERAPDALLALRWAGKTAVRVADDDGLYRAALSRGPAGLRLAAARGGRALLTRQPLLVALAGTVWKNPEALARVLAAVAAWLLRWATWSAVLAFSGALLLAAVVVRPRPRRRWRRAGPPAAHP